MCRGPSGGPAGHLPKNESGLVERHPGSPDTGAGRVVLSRGHRRHMRHDAQPRPPRPRVPCAVNRVSVTVTVAVVQRARRAAASSCKPRTPDPGWRIARYRAPARYRCRSSLPLSDGEPWCRGDAGTAFGHSLMVVRYNRQRRAVSLFSAPPRDSNRKRHWTRHRTALATGADEMLGLGTPTESRQGPA
jgi:hypothetical protein